MSVWLALRCWIFGHDWEHILIVDQPELTRWMCHRCWCDHPSEDPRGRAAWIDYIEYRTNGGEPLEPVIENGIAVGVCWPNESEQ